MEPTATLPALPTKPDFPDWLSPMLVKELRQGVRTRMFVLLFIILQVAMLLTISITLLVAAGGEDTAEGAVFFWLVVGGTILVALPLSALNAVGGEIKANTLELIFLTRQTAFRIVAGKWLATFVQALLFVCAVLPYLVLRYFVGGVNVTVELTTLALMLGGSALLTAFATGISAYPARIARSLAFLGCIFVIFALNVLPFLSGVSRASSGGVGPNVTEVVSLILCGALLLVLLLETGAARIAPPSENHSAVMRALAVGALLVAVAARLLVHSSEDITGLALFITTLVCLAALCEEPRWISSLYRPFASRGWWGRAAGHLLYPGWPTGVWFTLLIFLAFSGLLATEKLFLSVSHVVRFVALFGSLLFPAAIVRAFFPKTRRAGALYFAVLFACVALTILCLILDHNLRTSTEDICAVLPVSTLIFSLSDGDSDTAGHLVAVSFTTLASLIVLLVAARRPIQQTRLAETASLQAAAPPLVPPPGPETVHAPLA